MSRERIEIEKAENGYQITVWKKADEDAKTEAAMYPEPDKFVATDEKELLEIVKNNL